MKCFIIRFRSLTKQITDKCECDSLTHCLKDRQDDVLDIVLLVSFEAEPEVKKLEIEHKSLILAQIERWRHALHMQVGRQHREACFWVASGER